MKGKSIVLGITGRKQHGKSTIAEYLKKQYGFVETAFAYPLKDMLVKAGMATHEEVYGAQKNDLVRWLLQKIGTDIFREQVDPNYWVKQMIEIFPKDAKNVVVSDIRFPNEAQLIMSWYGGKIVKVIRPSEDSSDLHKSESLVEGLKADFTIINDSTIEDLNEKVDSLIRCIIDTRK
jgi:dephospho-CoA kinase